MTMIRSVHVLSTTLLAVGLTACPVVPPPPAIPTPVTPVKIAKVVVQEQQVLLLGPNDKVMLHAKAFDTANNEVKSDFNFASTNAAAIAVAPDGTVSANQDVGSASITVSAGGIAATVSANAVLAKSKTVRLVMGDLINVAGNPDGTGTATAIATGKPASVRAGDTIIYTGSKPFIAEISSVNTASGGINWGLKQVPLDQALEKFDLKYDLPITNFVPTGEVKLNAKSITLGDEAVRIHGLSVQTGCKTTSGSSGNFAVKYGTIDADFSGSRGTFNAENLLPFSGTPYLKVGFYEQVKVTYTSFEVSGSLGANVEMTCHQNLGRFPIVGQSIVVASIDGGINFGFYFKIKGTANGSIKVTGPTFVFEQHGEAGVEYRNGNLSAYKDFPNPTFRQTDPSIAASVKLTAEMSAGLYFNPGVKLSSPFGDLSFGIVDAKLYGNIALQYVPNEVWALSPDGDASNARLSLKLDADIDKDLVNGMKDVVNKFHLGSVGGNVPSHLYDWESPKLDLLGVRQPSFSPSTVSTGSNVRFQVSASGPMFPDKVDFRFGSGQTVCTAYRASGYTCDWTSSVTQQQTNTAYAIAWFGAYPVQVGSSNKLTVTVAGGGNPTGGGTQPDQPPAGFSRCASENSTCSFSGTAEVVYGAQTSFTAPRQFTGGVACNNSVFTDPIPGPTKSCYQRAVAVVPPVPPVLPGSFTTRVLRTLGLAMNYNIPTGNVVFLWAVDGTDDQKWEFIRQSGSGDNTVYQIRRYGTGSCLNGYAPGQLSTVNTYSCSSTDGDQLWNVIFAPGSNKRLIRQVDRGVGLWCLNAFSPVQNRGLTLYSCDLNDADQQFIFPDLP